MLKIEFKHIANFTQELLYTHSPHLKLRTIRTLSIT